MKIVSQDITLKEWYGSLPIYQKMVTQLTTLSEICTEVNLFVLKWYLQKLTNFSGIDVCTS